MNMDRRVLIILAVVIAIIPWLLPNDYQIGLGMFIGINVLIVIGLNLLLGYAGQISMGHAGFFGLGAYACGILSTTYHMEPWLTLLLALVFVGGVAALIGRPILRLKGHYLAMATLGLGIIIETIIAEMDWLTGGAEGLDKIPFLNIGGFVFQSELHFYYLVWGIVLLIQWGVINLTQGKIGRALKAIHTNEAAAQVHGVDLAKTKLQIFVFSAVLAGLAGGLYAFAIRYISPGPFDLSFSIILVTMVVVGGMGSLWGPLIGATILSLIPDLLRNFQSRIIKETEVLIYGLSLMIIVIFMPDGLADGLKTLKHKLFSLFKSKKSEGHG